MDVGDVVYGAVSTTPIALMSVILQSDPEWVMKYAEKRAVLIDPNTPLMRDKYTLLRQLGASEGGFFAEDGWHGFKLNKQAHGFWHSLIELGATVLQSHAMPSDEPLSELVTTQLAQMDALDAQIAAAVGSREASAAGGALVRPNVAIATPDCASLATLKVLVTPTLAVDTAISLQRAILRECKSVEIRLSNYGIWDVLSYIEAACFGGGMERAVALGRAADVALMLCVEELESLAIQADVEFVPPVGCVVPKVDPYGRRSVLAQLRSMLDVPSGEWLCEYTLLQTSGMAELADYLVECSEYDMWESGLGNPERYEVLLATAEFLVGLASGEAVLVESTVKAAQYTSELFESLMAHQGYRMPWQLARGALAALREAYNHVPIDVRGRRVGNYDLLSDAWGRVLETPLPPAEGKLVLRRGREMLFGGAPSSLEAGGCADAGDQGHEGVGGRNSLLADLRRAREGRGPGERSQILSVRTPAPSVGSRIRTVDDLPRDEEEETCLECGGIGTEANPLLRCMCHDQGNCVQDDGEVRVAAWHRSCCKPQPHDGDEIVCARHEAQARFRLDDSGKHYVVVPVPGFEEFDPAVLRGEAIWGGGDAQLSRQRKQRRNVNATPSNDVENGGDEGATSG